ncbi:phage tail protein [Paraburkholderia youngii]|uniref:phage tail protein n=1 Tax=Paraburkholderia youngii TaxID=2782701 RepID=UPI003D1D1B79
MASIKFPANPKRFDPYKNFKFRVKIDGEYVAGVSKVTALKRTTEVIEHRDGGDPSSPHRSPGRTKYEAITMERGMSQDRKFHRWALSVWNYTQKGPDGGPVGSEVSLQNFRRDLLIEIYNEAGQKVLAYKVYRAWVSEFSHTDLDANANAIWIESIKIENEGWELDPDVTEPPDTLLTDLV